MRRALLLLVLLTLPVAAAPRLKDRTPAPDPEDTRIAALRAKYAGVRASGDKAEGRKLDLAEIKLQATLLVLDDLARRQVTSEERQKWEQELEMGIQSDPILKDLYDIAMYDRKKAAGGK